MTAPAPTGPTARALLGMPTASLPSVLDIVSQDRALAGCEVTVTIGSPNVHVTRPDGVLIAVEELHADHDPTFIEGYSWISTAGDMIAECGMSQDAARAPQDLVEALRRL